MVIIKVRGLMKKILLLAFLFFSSLQATANVDRYQVGQGAHGIAIDESGQYAYVTTQADNHVTLIDLINKKTVKEIQVENKPNGISILNP